jgi:ribosomal protein S18 acetylase RimI-like enzyme
VLIRPASTADESGLAAVHRATWTTAVSPAGAPLRGARFFGAETRPEDVLVAADDGQVLGYVWLRRTGPHPAHDHVLVVDGLAVEPREQGRGIGRALVAAAVEEASRRGGRKLTLRVLAPNTAARQLYASAGFHVEGVLEAEFLLDGRLVDDVLMACDLTSDALRAAGWSPPSG